jgi:hypothetical protein
MPLFLSTKGGFFMPKNKFQEAVFSLCMVFVMVYAMVCYNVVLSTHVFNNAVFSMALRELPIMVPIAFLIEFFFVGRFAVYKAHQIVNLEKENPFHFVLAISAVTVACMCPVMSFVATILFQRDAVTANGLIATWIKTTALNFPVALFWQFFYAGPFVRFLFSPKNPIVHLFQKSAKKADEVTD